MIFLPPFSLSESLNSPFIPGLYDRMKSSPAFEGNDGSFIDGLCRRQQRLVMGIEDASVSIPQLNRRSAVGAGVGLSVETPVEEILIPLETLGAHPEMSHRRIGTIIGQRFNDAEAGTTICAVGKWITVAPVPGLHDFSEAIGAGGDIRKDERRLLAPWLAAEILKPEDWFDWLRQLNRRKLRRLNGRKTISQSTTYQRK